MSTELVTQSAPLFAVSTMEEAMAFSSQMAKANLLPAHLKNSPADCLRVVMQAARWKMDPFSVADKTSVISNKLMYEGQLVSAVVNARGNLSSKLSYNFAGEGERRVLTVEGVVQGESSPRTITLDVLMARKINKNGQMGINPDQQMCYIGARLWARRHTPELMLGVYTPDEVEDDGDEPKNVTPGSENPARPAPPPRAKKGVAAIIEDPKAAPAAAPEVITEVETVPAKAEAAKPAQTTEPAPAPAPAAGGLTTPRAFLNDKEEITAVCRVLEIETMTIMVPADGLIHTVKAKVEGDFTGEVYHLGGATLVTPAAEGVDAVLSANKPWVVGNTLVLTLLGRKRKDGVVRASVTKVEEQEEF